MAENAFKNSENQSEVKRMQAVLVQETDPQKAQRLIQERFPVIGGNVKAAIRQAARELGWSFSRAKNVWYQDARRIDGHEFDALERVKTASFLARVGRSREAMRTTDPEFFAEEIRALDAVVRSLSHKASIDG